MRFPSGGVLVKEPPSLASCLDDMEGKDTVATTTQARTEIEELFEQDAPRMWRSMFLATGDSELARDAVAEAFAQALRRGSELRDPGTWIWRAAFRIADREAASRRGLDQLEGDLIAPDEGSLIELFSALSALTKHQRTALVLADYAGYPHRAIAKILGSTTSAVGVHRR